MTIARLRWLRWRWSRWPSHWKRLLPIDGQSAKPLDRKCSHPRLFVPEDGVRRCALCHIERPLVES